MSALRLVTEGHGAEGGGSSCSSSSVSSSCSSSGSKPGSSRGRLDDEGAGAKGRDEDEQGEDGEEGLLTELRVGAAVRCRCGRSPLSKCGLLCNARP